MASLIARYGLALVEVSDHEVLLKSATYAIDVTADRDGVSMVYFDTTAKPPKGYNVFLFLLHKRRNQLAPPAAVSNPTTYQELVECELNSLAQHVDRAGKDILEGSREWIKVYPWPVLQPDRHVASLI